MPTERRGQTLCVARFARTKGSDPGFDPDSYAVYRNVFDNLITRNNKGEIVPQIATAWKQVSETVVEFQIRTDVLFHDGQKLTAEDVAYSARRITDPKFGSPQLGQFDKIIKAEVSAPNTVRLTTSGPYPALLAQLVKLSIVPKAVVEAVGKDAFNLSIRHVVHFHSSEVLG